jgi:undecaprenyl diphosphate synthase
MNGLKESIVPQHVAFIMDGNGRWAQQRLMPRTVGHQAGMEAMRKVIRKSGSLGIKVVTFYTFSTENWKRSQQEVDFLMRLPIEFIDRDLPEMMANQSKLVISGKAEGVPENTMKSILRGVEATKDNQGLIINLAFNYGGRDEIIRAIQKILPDIQSSKVDSKTLDEALFHSYLDQPLIPDPDLIIRTGGEQRLSNFLLWESAYAELYFAKEYWPDMNENLLDKILHEYAGRNRRFGGVYS